MEKKRENVFFKKKKNTSLYTCPWEESSGFGPCPCWWKTNVGAKGATDVFFLMWSSEKSSPKALPRKQEDFLHDKDLTLSTKNSHETGQSGKGSKDKTSTEGFTSSSCYIQNPKLIKIAATCNAAACKWEYSLYRRLQRLLYRVQNKERKVRNYLW